MIKCNDFYYSRLFKVLTQPTISSKCRKKLIDYLAIDPLLVSLFTLQPMDKRQEFIDRIKDNLIEGRYDNDVLKFIEVLFTYELTVFVLEEYKVNLDHLIALKQLTNDEVKQYITNSLNEINDEIIAKEKIRNSLKAMKRKLKRMEKVKTDQQWLTVEVDVGDVMLTA